jgi:hypothetical protein
MVNQSLQEAQNGVFGLIDNMSGFVCPHCGKSIDLFGTGGGFKTAMAMNIPFLDRIPLDPVMVQCADTGQSYMEKYPDSEVTKAYKSNRCHNYGRRGTRSGCGVIELWPGRTKKGDRTDLRSVSTPAVGFGLTK